MEEEFEQRTRCNRDTPVDLKREMRAAHLFSTTIKRYLDENICELMTARSFDWRAYSLKVLDGLFLTGAFPRDIVLGRRAHRHMEITLNLRQLTKLQHNHLAKYHQGSKQQSVDCTCAYWQRYLNKFKGNTDEPQREQLRFHTNTYIFNTRFFIDIIANSPELCGKLRISDEAKLGFTTVEIVETVQHEGYDVKGQVVRFIDAFESVDASLAVYGYIRRQMVELQLNHRYDQSLTELVLIYFSIQPPATNMPPSLQKSRWKSMPLLDLLPVHKAEDQAEGKQIDIEIYPLRPRDQIYAYDFSIDTALIPLSSITEFCDKEDDEVNLAIWYWEYIVENGLDDVDAIRHMSADKVLSAIKPGQERGLIQSRPAMYHFWRCIELMVQLAGFYVDDRLVAAHIEDSKRWLNVEYLAKEANRKALMCKLKEILTVDCQDARDVRTVLYTLQMFQFHERFVAILKEVDGLKQEMEQLVQGLNDAQMTLLFASYGYL